MSLRPILLPLPLDEAQAARLTALTESVVRAIDAGKPTKELIARFNADAKTQLTQFDFHSRAGTEAPRDFVERVLTHVPTVADLGDGEAAELVRRLQSREASPRERYYWLALLAKGLAAPGVTDLVEHPNQQLAPAELVRIARTCRGTALGQYLDPLFRGYHVARALLRRLLDHKLIALRQGASLDELARGAGQFLGRDHVSAQKLEALAAWLVEQPAVDELFANDEQLAQHLARV